MAEEKPIVSKEETFDKLEIRLGRIINVEEEPSAPKKAYRLKIDHYSSIEIALDRYLFYGGISLLLLLKTSSGVLPVSSFCLDQSTLPQLPFRLLPLGRSCYSLCFT